MRDFVHQVIWKLCISFDQTVEARADLAMYNMAESQMSASPIDGKQNRSAAIATSSLFVANNRQSRISLMCLQSLSGCQFV